MPHTHKHTHTRTHAQVKLPLEVNTRVVCKRRDETVHLAKVIERRPHNPAAPESNVQDYYLHYMGCECVCARVCARFCVCACALCVCTIARWPHNPAALESNVYNHCLQPEWSVYVRVCVAHV